MGIGGVTSVNSMSGMQMLTAGSTDTKSKSIQNEITNVRQQIQKVSSKEELSPNEKTTEQKKLQKEISDLNTELKQHQEELRRSRKREIMLAEQQKEQELAKEEKAEDKTQAVEASADKADEKNLSTDGQQTERQETVIIQNNDGTVILKGEMNQDEKSGVVTEEATTGEAREEVIAIQEPNGKDDNTVTDAVSSGKEMHKMISANSSMQQANRQGAVIAETRDGIAILKGEIKQDERYGINTEKKQAELEKMEKGEQRATTFQFSILGEANNTMKSAETGVFGREDNNQVNAFINALNISQEEQASQQRFYVSLGY